MKKLFISQPMRGKTDEEIKEERAKAIEKASELVGETIVVLGKIFGTFGRCRCSLFCTGLGRCTWLHHRTRLCDCVWIQKYCRIERR